MLAVLAQVWTTLRSQGIPTPEVAAWQRLPIPPKTFATVRRDRQAYAYVLNVYSAPQFQQVLSAALRTLRNEPCVCERRFVNPV